MAPKIYITQKFLDELRRQRGDAHVETLQPALVAASGGYEIDPKHPAYLMATKSRPSPDFNSKAGKVQWSELFSIADRLDLERATRETASAAFKAYTAPRSWHNRPQQFEQLMANDPLPARGFVPWLLTVCNKKKAELGHSQMTLWQVQRSYQLKSIAGADSVVPLAKFPLDVASDEWLQNRQACVGCQHHIPGMPDLCAVGGKQTSTHAINGTCPTGRQPFSLRQPSPQHGASIPLLAFGSNVGRSRPGFTPPPASPRPAFPIDVVYTWVDDADPTWRAAYRKAIGRPVGANTRFACADELLYSLRSIERFTPWVNRVWIVTADQTPRWLNAAGHRVTVVSHRDIIPSKYLPTFNSNAIEAHLHRIAGLAEHYLYFNDDMFIGAALEPGHFFTADGKAIIRYGGNLRSESDSSYAKMLNNAAATLDRIFSARRWQIGHHHVRSCRKSMMHELDAKIPDVIDKVSSHRGRSSDDVALNIGVWPAYAVAAGYGVQAAARLVGFYTSTQDTPAIRQAMTNAIATMPHLICVNNGPHEHSQLIRSFLNAYFPTESSFERPYWTERPTAEVEIVTGANKAQEDLLPFWFASLRRHHPKVQVLFADFGMSDAARQWCKRRGRVVVGRQDQRRSAWFGKPGAILRSIGRRVVWLDADVEVLADISSLWTTTSRDLLLPVDGPRRAQRVGNSGICALPHGIDLVSHWAAACAGSNLRGDQEVLFELGVRASLPPAFSAFDLRPHVLLVHHASRRRKSRLREQDAFRQALAQSGLVA